jgi:uncharacterized glyoxalase superfamily protein PhnB/chromosome segregation ATPase
VSATSITTILRYEDPRAAAEWLCGAFGFETQHAEVDGDGDVSYISLSFGSSGVLVCPTDSPLFEDLIVQPKDIGDRSTLTCYLTVGNVAKHCAAARAHGARIVREPLADSAGHEYYVCRDPDGHLWSFGNRTYAQAALSEASALKRKPARLRRAATLLAVAVFAAAFGSGGMLYLAKEGGDGLPAWLNAYVLDPVGINAGKTRRSPMTTTRRPSSANEPGDNERFAELRAALKTARTDLERARHKREATELALRTLRAESEKQTSENARLAAELEAVRAQMRREQLALESRITHATEALEVASRRAKVSEQQHDALREQIKAKQNALAQAEARATQLTVMVASLKQKLEEKVGSEKTEAYARLERLYRQAQHDAEEGKRALDEARKAVAQAKAANATFESRVTEINERLSKALETLKTVRAEKDKAVAELDRIVAETRVKQEAQSKRHAEDVVAERLAAKERAQFKSTIEALNAKLQRMLAALVQVRREKVAADQTLETTNRAADQKFEDKEKRLVALAAAYERVGQALKKERLTLDEIVNAFNATRTELTRVKAAEKELSAELSQARAQLQKSRQDLKVRVAILHILDTEVEVQRAERALARKRQEPPPPLPTLKGKQQPTAVVSVPRQPPPVNSSDKPEETENGATAGSETCSRAARRRLSNFLGWRSPKSTSAIAYLCRGAETSIEPVECFRKVIWGTVSWGRGGNRPWSVKNALTLCSGTLSAHHTLLCLKRQLEARTHWRTAIEQCTTNW